MAQASAPLPRRTSPISTAELRELIARVDTVADLKKLMTPRGFEMRGRTRWISTTSSSR